jgi:hypothetical protein
MDTRNELKKQVIKWLQQDIPEIAVVPILLEDNKYNDLGIDGLENPITESEQYIDFSKLSGLRVFYEKNSDIPSETACVIMLENTRDMVIEVPLQNMVDAWMYYKKWKYGK